MAKGPSGRHYNFKKKNPRESCYESLEPHTPLEPHTIKYAPVKRDYGWGFVVMVGDIIYPSLG